MTQPRFIVDTQLPPVLAAYFKRKGFDATHTTNYSSAQFLSDAEIRSIAIAENRIIVTKDEDFADYYWAKGSPPRVLQLTLGNIRNNDLINLLENNLAQIVDLFEQGIDFVIFGREEVIAY
jgi:predicted nuclease of predicted toxin-antitoxin system